jgi:uncharacterized repeat protein (TIGR01451 family)
MMGAMSGVRNGLETSSGEDRTMRRIVLGLAVVLLTMVVGASPAEAAGTLAGTAISNQAYGDYKDANSNAMPRVYSNTVTTTVSRVAGVAIVPPTVTSVAKNGDTVDFLTQLFNTGNAADNQTFTYATSGDWTPTTVQMWWDKDNSHSYTSGDVLLTETAAGSRTYKTVDGTGAPLGAPVDDDYDVILRLTVPSGAPALDNTNSVVTITTKSDFDSSKTTSGAYTTTVQAAVIAAVKSHTPAGSPTRLQPGEIITYTITLTNAGTTAGNTVVVSDPLPAGLAFVPGSLRTGATAGALTARTDASDNDGIAYDAGTRTVSVPDGATTLTLAAGATWVIRFQAVVNAGVASGTAITNQATVSYTSGTNNVELRTGGDTFFISTLAGINLRSTDPPRTGDPGDVVTYAFTVENGGNANDIVNLVYFSTQGWTWAIWADANGDGIPGTGGDHLITDTNGDGNLDTGDLPEYGTIALLAVATIPVGTANGTAETVTITGTSVDDPTKSDPQAFTTTVRAPVLSVVKGLTAVLAPTGGTTCVPTNTTNGSPCTVVPGAELTYTVTVTNSGHGNATSVVITDIVPLHTTYKTGSIRTGATLATLTARTDAADGDGAEYNAGSNSIVVPDGGALTIGATGTSVIQFTVTVN